MEECSICLEPINKNDSLRFTVCAHKFHEKCLKKHDEYCIMNNKHTLCPLCNNQLDERHIEPVVIMIEQRSSLEITQEQDSSRKNMLSLLTFTLCTFGFLIIVFNMNH
jgi:hypothetical protein